MEQRKQHFLDLYSLNSFFIFSAESLYDFFFSLHLSKANRPELTEAKAVITAITHFSQFLNPSLGTQIKKVGNEGKTIDINYKVWYNAL